MRECSVGRQGLEGERAHRLAAAGVDEAAFFRAERAESLETLQTRLQEVPATVLRVLPQAAHNLPNEDPEAVVQEIIRVLAHALRNLLVPSGARRALKRSDGGPVPSLRSSMHDRPSNRQLTIVIACSLALATAPPLPAQERSPAVQQAIQQREAGEFDSAVRLLQPYVARTPQDVEAARLLAQTLYWLKRPDDARAAYDAALLRHPTDAALSLEFGRMLAETGDGKRARAITEPFSGDPIWGPSARALLGTIAYWNGDLTAARRLMRNALQADPALEETRKQLGEIAAATAPWIEAGGELRSDDQPLGRRNALLAAGVNATPNLSLTARALINQLASADSVSLGVQRLEAGFAHYAAIVRIETDATIGLLQRESEDANWTGRARAGLRLPRHLTIRAIAEREPYLYTVASLHTPVVTNTASALIALNSPRGWLGEAVVQRAWFPDDNAVSTFYGWLLAPVARSSGAVLQVGYGYAWQNADESRFVLADSTQPFPPGDPRFNGRRVYSPYFTPDNFEVHSALANVEKRTGRLTLRAAGSYGVRATDKAWTARGEMDFAATEDLTFRLNSEAMQAAFYHAITSRAGLTWRFASAARRRATR